MNRGHLAGLDGASCLGVLLIYFHSMGLQLDPEEIFGVAVVMLVGCVGGVVWLGLILEQRFRRDTEEHFMGLAVENDARRKSLRKNFGTESFSEVNDGS